MRYTSGLVRAWLSESGVSAAGVFGWVGGGWVCGGCERVSVCILANTSTKSLSARACALEHTHTHTADFDFYGRCWCVTEGCPPRGFLSLRSPHFLLLSRSVRLFRPCRGGVVDISSCCCRRYLLFLLDPCRRWSWTFIKMEPLAWPLETCNPCHAPATATAL